MISQTNFIKNVYAISFLNLFGIYLVFFYYLRARYCVKGMDKLIKTIIEGLQDAKAHDIQVIDMSKLEEAAFTYFVVCEGTSSTHVSGIAYTLTNHVRETLGQRDLGHIGLDNRLWVAVDYGYVLVHIFQPETRDFYKLESLWEDAKITKIPDLD